jgi:hypothetical protein
MLRSTAVAQLAVTAALALVYAAPAHAIVGGTATTDFKALGYSPFASNVQIADNWLITARHVSGTVGGAVSNAFGASTIAAVYNFSNAAFPANDLTLLRLNTPLLAGQHISISADIFAPGALATPLDVTIASARNATPRGYGFATLREVEPITDPDDTGPLLPVTSNFLLTYGLLSDGPYVQPGDSGGALFLGHVTDQITPLLGITSAQLQYTDNNVQRFGSAFVQLSMYRSWIDNTMLSDLADNQTALWVSAVPEPATAALWLVGLAVLLGSTRKTRG